MNVVDIRQAVLMAADKIERFPEQFNFFSVFAPANKDGCGCAIGWTAYFMGLRGCHFGDATEVLTGARNGDRVFYTRMNELQGPLNGNWMRGWKYGAINCAAALRRYADVYLALPDHTPTPTGEQLCCPLSVAGVGSCLEAKA